MNTLTNPPQVQSTAAEPAPQQAAPAFSYLDLEESISVAVGLREHLHESVFAALYGCEGRDWAVAGDACIGWRLDERLRNTFDRAFSIICWFQGSRDAGDCPFGTPTFESGLTAITKLNSAVRQMRWWLETSSLLVCGDPGAHGALDHGRAELTAEVSTDLDKIWQNVRQQWLSILTDYKGQAAERTKA